MTDKLFIFPLLFAIMIATSCTSENIPMLNNVEEATVRAVADEWSVSEGDILSVVEKIGLDRKSRAQDYSISSICDSKGKPCVYVVNFGSSEGYVLISATKKYDPVLAFSYKGHYTVGTNKHAGLRAFEKEMCEAIEYVDEMPEDSLLNVSKIWKFYLGSEQKNYFKDSIDSLKSRTLESYELGDVMNAYVNMCRDLRNQGYEILEMGDLSEQENSMIKEYVDGITYPDYEDIRYQICIVASKTEDKSTFIDNFVRTAWEQQNGFNSEFPYWNGNLVPVGCGALAVGQIMRYYEHPSKYNWGDMPLDRATATTSKFLYDVAYSANPYIIYGDCGTQPSGIKKAFKEFGYKSEHAKLSESKVYENMKEKKPVFLSGYAYDNGHAWIASGYKKGLYYSKKQLFVIAWPNKYDSVLTFDEDSFVGAQYVYYNWGYNDGYDGFYKLSHCTSGAGKEYSENREMFYNIEPVK
ncbi:MAG: C10 family peptidase [Clostridium sp.]|nr:C10 family peptidase [Clostridium sp.]